MARLLGTKIQKLLTPSKTAKIQLLFNSYGEGENQSNPPIFLVTFTLNTCALKNDHGLKIIVTWPLFYFI